MDPFIVGMIVVIASIVSGAGTALVVSNRMNARHKREMLGAGDEQKLLPEAESNELIKKLTQLGGEQRQEYYVLVEAKVDEIVNHILEIPAVKYYSVNMESLFPKVGRRSPPNQLAEYILENVVCLLRHKRLTVNYEEYPGYNMSGKIEITW